MKRIIAVILALVLAAMLCASCGQAQKNDSLTVYADMSSPYVGDMAQRAMDLFEEQTGIEVTLYEQRSPDATPEEYQDYRQRLNAAILSGTGPDVFLAFSDFDKELYRMMDAGAFLDLSELIEGDESFQMERYEANIMDAGVYADHRYLLPLTYNVPLLFTTQAKLDAFGVGIETFQNYETMLDTALDFQNRDLMLFDSSFAQAFLCTSAGWLSEMTDFESKTVNTEVGTIDSAVQVMKDEVAMHAELGEVLALNHEESAAFSQGLFSLWDTMGAQMKYLSTGRNDDSLVMAPIPNCYGSNTATVMSYTMISSATKNRDNAWNFVKILLGDDIQGNLDLGPSGPGIGVASGLVADSLGRAAELNAAEGPIPEASLARMEEIYTGCDNAVIVFINPGAVSSFYFQGYIHLGEQGNIEEMKATAKSELELWMNE